MMPVFWAHPAYSLLHMFIVGYWRDGHFYWVHRLMHPWGWSPDGGKWLYKVRRLVLDIRAEGEGKH